MNTDTAPQPAESMAPAEETLSRRLFVRVAVAAAGCGYAGLIGYPVYRYLASPVPFEKAFPAANVKEVTLPEAQKLARGSVLTFMFGLKPAMLIHHANGEWSALSAVCTHLGCTVKYEPQHPRIYCSCHGGIYDPSTGANLAGPPPRPLERYTVVVGKESVTVSKG